MKLTRGALVLGCVLSALGLAAAPPALGASTPATSTPATSAPATGTPGASAPATGTPGAGTPATSDRVVAAEPALVYIETSVVAQGVLHDMGNAVGLIVRPVAVPPQGSGTGVVINPSGTIVTTGSVVDIDLDAAKIYTENQLFASHYNVTIPGNQFSRQHLTDPTLDGLLQQCYSPVTSPTGMNLGGTTCVVYVTRQVKVYPFVTKQANGGLSADVLRQGTGPNDAAVLSITGSNRPTVGLASSLGSATTVSTLGFSGVPGPASTPAVTTQTLTPPGSSHLSSADLAAVRTALRSKVVGAPLISTDTGSVVGLVAGASDGTILPAETITDALRSLGIRPARSAVDATFAEAVTYFRQQQFNQAVPRLRVVLTLDPENALAQQMLQTSLGRPGVTAGNTSVTVDPSLAGNAAAPVATGDGGSGVSGWLIVLYVGLALLALGVVAAFLFGRRVTRGASRPGPGGMAGTTSDPGVSEGTGGPDGPDGGQPDAAEPLAARLLPVTSGADLTRTGQAFPQPPDAHRNDRLGWTAPRPVVPVAAPSRAAPAGVESEPGTVRSADPATRAADRKQRYCTQCGNELGLHHRFCGLCGTALQ